MTDRTKFENKKEQFSFCCTSPISSVCQILCYSRAVYVIDWQWTRMFRILNASFNDVCWTELHKSKVDAVEGQFEADKKCHEAWPQETRRPGRRQWFCYSRW